MKSNSEHSNDDHHHGHQHHHDEQETTHYTLEVSGMSCTNCALGIIKTLEKKQLKNVNANFASGEVTFEITDNHNIKLPEIVNIIEKLGFEVISKKSPRTVFSLEKKFLFCLIFTLPLVSNMFLPAKNIFNNAWLQFVLCLPVFFIGIIHFGKSAYSSIKSGVANMDVLIITGAASAFIYSLIGTVWYAGSSEMHHYLFYETTSTIITLVLLGNLLEHRSVKQTTSAIEELTKMQKIKATKLVIENQTEIQVTVEFSDIKIDDILLVNSGDKIPVDGEIIWGDALIDESMISGESIPQEKKQTEKVIGGTILLNGSIKIRAEKVGNETVLSKIIELVKNAQQQKPKIQKLGDKVSAVFVPIVLLISLLTFTYWFFIADASLNKSLMTSIAVLVISCPCAMGLATPTAIIVGIGRAAKNGVLIKGGATIELLAQVKTIFFDKTGTLTTGDFKIKNIEVFQAISLPEIKNIFYSLEQYSNHPIAKSIVKELSYEAEKITFSDIEEIKGIGIKGIDLSGNEYTACSKQYVNKEIKSDKNFNVFLLKNNEIIAGMELEDEIKSSASETIQYLNDNKIKTVLISGDIDYKCKEVGKNLNIKEIFSQQLPHQKLQIISQYQKQATTAMVGDGINDAPALAKSDVGISISNASQIALQTAQVILLNKNDLSKLNYSLQIGKHTLITIKQNLFWAFFYNALAIPIAASGLLNPMIAALAMAFSDVIVVGNSLRLKNKKIN